MSGTTLPQPHSHTKIQRLTFVVSALIVMTAAALGVTVTGAELAPARAHAAVCYPVASNGIVYCDDGSVQYIDQRGHYICVAPNGVITCDIPPGQPRY